MAIDKQLSAFMPHTVTIAPYTAKNNYGEDTYTSTRTAPAYVEPSQNVVMGNQSSEEIGSKQVYISDTTITLRDKITLPDGSTPKISSIAVHTEVLGLEHTVVTFI